MDGVTILNTIEVTGISRIVIIAFMASFIIGLFLMSILELSENSCVLVYLLIDLIVFIGCVFVSWYQSENHKTGEIRYEVTIDDTVSMTEFNKKYEIIEQRGDIFVVKEKNNE